MHTMSIQAHPQEHIRESTGQWFTVLNSLVGAKKTFRALDCLYQRDQPFNVVTKDNSTDVVRNTLLPSVQLGQMQLGCSVEELLISNKETGRYLNVPMRRVLKKNSQLTFDCLYKVRILQILLVHKSVRRLIWSEYLSPTSCQ